MRGRLYRYQRMNQANSIETKNHRSIQKSLNQTVTEKPAQRVRHPRAMRYLISSFLIILIFMRQALLSGQQK